MSTEVSTAPSSGARKILEPGELGKRLDELRAAGLLDSGRGWVKLSGAYLYGGGTPPDYAGASAAAKGYIRSAPERCVWGSDWPHPDATKVLNPVAMPDDITLLNLMAQWAPEVKLRHRILVENPERFYCFDPSKRPKAL